MNSKVHEIILAHAGLPAGVEITEDTDLYRAGMKSFSSVQLMLALEEAFDIEFPEEMLNRATFRSPAAIEQAVSQISADALAA